MDDDLELDFERFVYRQTRTPAGDMLYVRVGCQHRHVEQLQSRGEDFTICLDCNSVVSGA
jgi:hypothetical protein